MTKITYEPKKHQIVFSELKVGDFFSTDQKNIYLRTNNNYDAYSLENELEYQHDFRLTEDIKTDISNCFSINYSVSAYFPEGTLVTPLNVTIKAVEREC